MNKKILAASLLSIFAFSFVVAGASAEIKAEKKTREAREKLERRVVNKIATSTNATSTSSSSSLPKETFLCIGEAVKVRENSIISAQDVFSSNMKTALEKRKEALISAWSTNTPTRKADIKNAWNNFKTSSKDAVNTLKNSKKSAWSIFETARKNCKSSISEAGLSEENEGKGIDLSVSN